MFRKIVYSVIWRRAAFGLAFTLAGTLFASGHEVSAESAPDSVASQQLREVTVTAQGARQRIADTRLGAERLELSRLAQVPMLFGENDIIKSITLMPGVHGEGDGAGGFEVRGGNASQNLVQLDGITLYNPAHVMGIFSTFNDDALGRATLYKGPIPASYGGATSAVLETHLAPGDMERYHGSATVGLLAAKLHAEGPLVRDKLSFALAARRSYVDLFLKMVPEYRSTVMNFYDVTAKLRYTPRPGDYLDLSFMAARDNMAISDIMGMYWGNLGASLNWYKRCGGRLRFVTTASFTHYDPKMEMSVMSADQRVKEYIHDYNAQTRAEWTVAEGHTLEAGLRTELFRVLSGEFEVNGIRRRDLRSGWLNAVWAGYEGVFSERVSISAGTRLSVFSAHAHVNAEPRLSLKYNLSQLHTLKAGAGLATQNLHAIRANTTSFPFDRYALTSSAVKPERAMQYGLGYAGMTASGAFDWSAEAYYKDLHNVYDFKDGRTMFSEVELESIIAGGRGRSYGLELMARKNSGRLTGWASYTLSRTQTRIPGINGGEWYDASNDRRHDFSLTAMYRLSDRWNLSGTWIFSSGQPITAPDAKFELDGKTIYYYSRRNGYRTPPVHRLDLSATYTRIGKRFTYRWAFGLYNAYCRYNPYVVYFEDDPSKPSGTRAVQQALFGLVPSVSYTLKF